MDSHQAVGSDLDIQEWGSEPILKNVNKVLFAECGESSARSGLDVAESSWSALRAEIG